MGHCRHIDQVFKNEKSREGVLKSCNAARFILKHSIMKQKYLYAMRCSTCKEINAGSTFMCLQCDFSGCWNNSDFANHSKQMGHIFSINSSNGLLFCFKCVDYIGDVEQINYSMLNKFWDDISKKTHITSQERKDGLFGLVNMGSTCFMSSILQTLIHNPYVVNYSMCQTHYNMCQSKNPLSCTSCALDLIITEFYATESKGNNSSHTGFISLLNSLLQVNENFAGYSQQDAHEFLQFILNQIHNDYKLNSMEDVNSGNTTAIAMKTLPGTQNSNNNNNNTNHIHGNDVSCKCLSHSNFQGSLKSSILCPQCNNDSKTTIDPFMDLSLDVKDKSNLYQCLDSFHKLEKLHDFNFHCSECNSTQDPIKQLTLNKLSPLLVFQLKRFEHLLNGTTVKINDFIEYPLYLNMKTYCQSSNNDTEEEESNSENVPDMIYELTSIISHKGTVNEGHYIVVVKVNDGQWFKFNDSMVSAITEEEALKQQAYLLFYSVFQLN
ncbi:ubiquitin-specific protease UBP8 NDAI_0E00810 [Naumovozyma dairenensis CBS 421]|uniref:Ubiquitin carboxyl-terminal hydrolase n=1 Tax=Naumovozyma dairenensis (strain ATCC 10597 / BCRC 20456 / CBS 421 / NBRC 0211 / NRRL Y-12639) TaxID=1071378 RepID=G0WAX7_NAUDC|nr:hypothetical protein NDAI_0E00810 [Naumovozyma dairenensis CBS 421]CCD24897.1 hypothetical protein NDAI_0E00810 [Naumovozyma dairenensis CBS 421]